MLYYNFPNLHFCILSSCNRHLFFFILHFFSFQGEKNIVTEEDQAQATVAGAEKAVREQLDVMEAEDETKTGDESTATGATGNAEKRAEQVTSSIADEAVASVLRVSVHTN